MMDVKSRHDVLEHGELLEEPDLLEGTRDSAPHAAMSGQAGEIGAIEAQRAGIRLVDPADQVEHRGFAGAVGADDGKDRAGRHVERYVAHGADAAEALVQTLGAEQCGHCDNAGAPVSLARTSFQACTSPPGMNSTTRVSATP